MAPASKTPLAAHNNGVITDNSAPVVNRKKQKRRQKEAARRAAASDKQAVTDYASDDLDDSTLAPPPPPPPPPPPLQSYAPARHAPQADLRYDSSYEPGPHGHFDGDNGTEIAYSDDENQYAYDPAYSAANGADAGNSAQAKKKSKKKKKKNRTSQYDDAAYDDPALEYSAYDSQPQPQAPLQGYVRSGPAISDEALRTVHQRVMDPIWDSSSVEEKSKIRSFWIGLREEERKSLVKIEKEAVLKKMKEQQKHSCSCTVCGRKRTAIEEELEVLYDAYYEELEQYQRQVGDGTVSSPQALEVPKADQLATVSQLPKPSRGRIRELPQDEDEDNDPEDDDYSDGDYDDDFSDDEADSVPPGAEDIFAFGRSLTVRGGILTVADDLLRNDGRKFIDMMEKLADRRMRRENRVFKPYKNSPHLYYSQSYHQQSEDEEEDEYEDDEYDSVNGDDEFDDEDEMDTMTEQQRMQEGRRMFQIFAARMFEQRVLNAYREKVARERQDRLIAEMEEETRADSQRDAKKARDAEKKKAKKQAQKQQKAEEKARKDAERAAAESAAKEAEAKKQEEQRTKREEQRKKREAERKLFEEEKQRKEAEKQKRLQEERARQQETERKAREAKAEEKRRKEEARKRDREEKEARESASREKKAQDEKAKRDYDDDEKPEAETKRKPELEAIAQQTNAQEAPKRAGASATVVAVPPGLQQQRSHNGQPSPQEKSMAAVLPKATPPMRQRDSSAPTSSISDPLTPELSINAKPTSPPAFMAAPAPSLGGAGGSMRGPSRQPQPGFPHPMSPSQGISPPPGMPYSQNPSFVPMPPPANGFPGPQQPISPGISQGFPPQGRPLYPQGPTMSFPHRPHAHAGGMGLGMNAQTPSGMAGRGFVAAPGPNSFGQGKDAPVIMNPRASQGPARDPIGHSRQASASFDAISPADATGPPAAAQPIARPAPIKRPESTKPGDKARHADADDETEHFGSSALLSDALDDLPEDRRGSGGHFPVPHLGGSFDHGFGAFGGVPRHHPGFPPMGSNAGWGAAPGGWSGPAFGQPAAAVGRPGSHRPATVRKLACQAFVNQQSSAAMEVSDLLRQMDKGRPASEAPISMADLTSILDTEGDSNNGGGSFATMPQGPNRTLVSWVPDHGGLGGHRGSGFGLGEIGSPMPGNNLPALGRH